MQSMFQYRIPTHTACATTNKLTELRYELVRLQLFSLSNSQKGARWKCFTKWESQVENNYFEDFDTSHNPNGIEMSQH